MTKRWVVVMVMALTVVGCQLNRVAQADPATFPLNQPFALAGGREATISGEDLRLRFTEVLEDSRCPTRVECFWTGQARIAILVQPSGREATTVDFNTNPAPGQGVESAKVGDYTVALQSLDPHPEDPSDPIAFEDYRATLSVTLDS